MREKEGEGEREGGRGDELRASHTQERREKFSKQKRRRKGKEKKNVCAPLGNDRAHFKERRAVSKEGSRAIRSK